MEIQTAQVSMLPDGRMNDENAALYLGVKRQTMQKWRCNGQGPKFVKLGSKVFYYKYDLDGYLNGLVCTSTAQARLLGA
jgi:hypothetical protein